VRREPWFWAGDNAMAQAVQRGLSPLGWIYGAISAAKLQNQPVPLAGLTLICIGNATLGGSGKTPFARALADQLADLEPAFLTRGYGGRIEGPIRVSGSHDSADIGDEAMLLSAYRATWVARNRAAGARAAAEAGVRVLISDDGYQNPSLAKDVSILLIDDAFEDHAFVFPAGRYRERPSVAVKRADAVLFVRSGLKGGFSNREKTFADGRLIGEAALVAEEAANGTPVLGFCGIARPARFRATLEQAGYCVRDFIAYPDHHIFSPADLAMIKKRAATGGLGLITTEKDACRLGPAIMTDLDAQVLRIKMTYSCDGLVSLCREVVAAKTRNDL